MNQSNKLLSDVTAFRTYAKYIKHLERRESLEETINRAMTMHLDMFPKLSRDIIKAFQRVHELKVMPSMRGLQFAGEAVLKNHARQYNCSYAPINNHRSFGESMFLLLSGVGFGFSVQRHHVNQLPSIQKPREEGIFVIHDSIQGWSQAVDALLESFFFGGIRPIFDYKSIRAKGSYLSTTGAKAPGPEPLKKALELIEERLKTYIGRKMKPIEVYDIICIISDSVLAGGIRRAALICLFDRFDNEMLKAKHGEWWNFAPWRARANNSAVLPRSEVTREEFDHIFKMCQDSGSGEPGFSWSNDKDWGYNPCFTGDTLVAVADGRNAVSIKQLAEENYTGPVYTVDKGQVTVGHCSKVWKTRKNSELVKVTLDDGSTVRCTPDHRFMLRNGNYIKAKDLKPNTSLMPFNSFKRPDRNYRMISLNTGKNLAQYRYIAQYYDITKDGYDLQHIHHKDGNGFNDFPSNLEAINACEHNREHMLGEDNPIHKFKNRNTYRKANSKARLGHNNPNSNGIVSQEMLALVIKATVNKEKKLSYQETLNACKVKFLSKNRLAEMGFKNVKDLSDFAHKTMNHKVVSVDFLEEKEDVYDLTVDTTHNFAIITSNSDVNFIESSGVFVHNCHEIALNPNQFCNLSTINQTGITSEKDFFNRVYAAALIGTLQASYTDFHYLRPIWRETTEREALLGISFTGIADGNNFVTADLLRKGAQLVTEVNEKYAKKIGINVAARTTAIKPEGTSSCVLGSSSGVHARHAPYYIRRIRMNKDDALAVYLKHAIPELVEDDVTSSSGVVVSFPQESPGKSIIRAEESALGLLDRAIFYNKNWINPGHREGSNKHNVSVTISVKDEEWDSLREAMWENREHYSGISLLPYDGGNYKQAPFEDITKEKYEEMSKLITDLDLKQVREEKDNTDRMGQLACVGGVCEIP